MLQGNMRLEKSSFNGHTSWPRKSRPTTIVENKRILGCCNRTTCLDPLVTIDPSHSALLRVAMINSFITMESQYIHSSVLIVKNHQSKSR